MKHEFFPPDKASTNTKVFTLMALISNFLKGMSSNLADIKKIEKSGSVLKKRFIFVKQCILPLKK